jgi:putative ABC transport system permease protein
MMDQLWRDLRYALRQLVRSPGFTAIAVLTLGLGIGANTAIFSVVNAALLRPLPYQDPSSLVKINETRPDGSLNSVSYPNFIDWRKENGGFRSVALFRDLAFNLAGRAEPERIAGALVSADFFRTLGITPVMGRYFAEGEDQAGGDGVAVISYALWQRRFGGERDVVGRSLTVDGRALTVIGVATPDFNYPERADAWIPVSHDAADLLDNRGLHAYVVIGRLLPGVSLDRAAASLRSLAARLGGEYPATNKGWGVVLAPLHESLVRDVRPTLLVLLGAVGFVLLIASANVANMMLARSVARRRELSIRTALGASRWRLVRQLLTESVLIALFGGVLGLVLATWGVDALLALGPEGLPAGEGVVLDRTVLGFTLGISVITSLVFGLIPAAHAARRDAEASLRESSRGSGGLERRRTRRVLVVAEIALALLLLVGTGLMVQSFRRLQAVNPGFNPDGVVSALLSLPRANTDTARVIGFYQGLVARAGSLPGVTAAAAVSYLPLGRDGARYRFSVEGQPFVEPQLRPGAEFNVVTPGYFATLEIPVLQGRDLDGRDRWDAPPVVVVNRTLARRFWPNESAVGKRLTLGEPGEDAWMTVVGVVGDVKQQSLDSESQPQIYGSHAQVGLEEMALLVRTAMDPTSLAPAIRDAVSAIDPGVPVSEVQNLTQVRSASISTERFRTLVLATFALLALALAAIGVYGVISYDVVQRSREIGIRMALGARRPEILRLVVGEGMVTVAIGIGIGVLAAAGLSRFLESLLYAVRPGDPATFVAIPALIAAVALAACILPARRAMRVDPAGTLRSE